MLTFPESGFMLLSIMTAGARLRISGILQAWQINQISRLTLLFRLLHPYGCQSLP
jgi:hypothetical protein